MVHSFCVAGCHPLPIMLSAGPRKFLIHQLTAKERDIATLLFN